jgi:hypothetical protein
MSLPALAQNPCSYQILNAGNYTMPQLQVAFDNAKLDAYRFHTLRRTLKLDQNAEVQLLSGLEMSQNGCPVDILQTMPDQTPTDPNRIFSIHSSGFLMETAAPRSKR